MKSMKWVKPIITAVVLCSVVASMGVVGQSYLSRKSRGIAEQTLPALSHMAMANQCRGQAFLHLLFALNADDAAEFQQHEEMVRSYSDCSQKELDAYQQFIATDKNRNLFDQLMTERDRYIKSRDAILLLGKAGNRERAMKELIDQLLPMYEQYLNNGQKLVEYASQEGVDRANAIGRISRWAQVVAFIASLLIFVFGFFLGFTR